MMQALKMRAELPQTVVAAVTPSTDEDQEIQRIQQMIQNSPDLINRASSDEGTPLFSAASKDQMRVAGFLLDHGADVNAPAGTHGKIWDTWTPLMAAADYGHKTMVDLLLSRGADVNWKNKGGETALYRAVLRGFQAVTEGLGEPRRCQGPEIPGRHRYFPPFKAVRQKSSGCCWPPAPMRI